MRIQLGQRIKAYADGGGTVLLVTHDPALLLATAGRCLHIDDDVHEIAADRPPRKSPGANVAQNAAVGEGSAVFSPVQYTRRASWTVTRGRSRFRDIFVDAYSALLALGTIGAFAAGLVLVLREQMAQVWDADPAGRTLVAPPWFALPDGAAATALLFAVLGIARHPPSSCLQRAGYTTGKS